MKKIIKHLFTATLLTGLSIASLHAEEARQPQSLCSKTQEGVTVTLEKLTVERILNEAAWLGEIGKGSKDPKIEKARIEAARSILPVRRLTCFVSVLGDVNVYGPTKIVPANGKVEFPISGASSASPPAWQRRFRDMAVNPEAAGIETWMIVSAKTPISELFPAHIEVQATKSDGTKLTFVFEDVVF